MTPATTKEDHKNKAAVIRLRESLGESHAVFAERIGTGSRMIWYYESGEQAVPKPIAKLVSYMAKEQEASTLKEVV